MAQKSKIKQKEQEIVDLARKLCLEKINEEYADLTEKLIRKMGRKRTAPFERGRSDIWAGAAVYCIGTVNFLFDRTFLPYISADELCGFYDLKKSTVGNKATQIREMMNIGLFDPEFTTEHIKRENPFNKIKMDKDGFLFFEDENEDEDDLFDDDELLEELWEGESLELPMINRTAILVRPKQPFVDWLNGLKLDETVTLDDYRDFNSYLVTDDELEKVGQTELEELVLQSYADIFQNEFALVWPDTDDWPETVSIEMFKEWFEYIISPLVFDVGLEDEDEYEDEEFGD